MRRVSKTVLAPLEVDHADVVPAGDRGTASSTSSATSSGTVVTDSAPSTAAGVEACKGKPRICAPLWTSTTELVPVEFHRLQAGSGLTSAPAVANGVVYVVGIDDVSCDVNCTMTRHLVAFDGSGVQGCTCRKAKLCSPLFHATDPLGAMAFGEPIVANGIVYVSDSGFLQTGPPGSVMHTLTPKG